MSRLTSPESELHCSSVSCLKGRPAQVRVHSHVSTGSVGSSGSLGLEAADAVRDSRDSGFASKGSQLIPPAFPTLSV